MFALSKFQFAACLVSVLFVVSCGGGGGSGGDAPPATTSSSSVSNVAAPIANPGSNVTVNAGAVITLDPHAVVTNATGFTSGSGNLSVTGSSTTATDIVGIQWTKVTGPSIALSTSSTTTGIATFTAPSTGSAANIQITYRLTLTNAGGQKGEAMLTITVNRVNQAPSISLSKPTQSVLGNTANINLAATASDSDGTIKSYLWKQVGGTSVVLANTTTNTASFTAPSTNSDLSLTFELTVTDNDDAPTKATATVMVTPENAPQISISFPSDGIYKGSSLSAAGSVSSPNNAAISSVTLDAGAGSVTGNIDARNNWRVSGLAMPSGLTSFPLTITLTDVNGLKSSKTLTIQTAGTTRGSGGTWTGTKHLVVDTFWDELKVMTTGVTTSDVRLFELNTATGNRKDISLWTDGTKGINPTPISGMAAYASDIFATINPTSGEKQVILIKDSTGQRSLVSDSTRGTGPAFNSMFDMAICSNTLYVVDNGAGALLTVDKTVGTRKVIADGATLPYSISAPHKIACGASSSDIYLTPYYAGSMYFWKINTLSTPATSSIVSDSDIDPIYTKGTGAIIAGPIKGMSYVSGYGKLVVVDANGVVFFIDTATGNREQLGSIGASPTSIAFIGSNLYIADKDGTSPYIAVADIYTGNKVIISK